MKKITTLFLILLPFAFCNAQVVNIPDANFKAALINYPGIDINMDGEVQVSEALQITHLQLSSYGIGPNAPNISSQTSNLTGLNAFTNLTSMIIEGISITSFNIPSLTNLVFLELISNPQLLNVNVSTLTNLVTFKCAQSNLGTLDVSTLVNLEHLNCEFNSLNSLDVSNLTNLTMLSCSYNQIGQLDLFNQHQLTLLGVDHNNLTTLDLTNTHELQRLYCSNNELTDLIIPDAPYLYAIECDNNPFTSLDFSHTGILKYPHGGSTNIYLFDLPELVFLNLKTGYPFDVNSGYILSHHPIQYVCADEFNIDLLTTAFSMPLSIGTNVGSYCDFVPGGDHNTVTGMFTYDADGNGCDFSETRTTSADFPFENVRVALSGDTTNSTYSNSDGHYTLFSSSGNYTVTPAPIPYFNFSPTSASGNFADTDNNTNIHNFCISPNGVHNDLEIVILNLGFPAPGFDSRYRLVYKNKGTQVMNGTIDLTFDDAVMDFVSANPALSAQSLNHLIWNFTDLNLFETRAIEFTTNLNGPMETPPMNVGDVVHFTAVINPIAGDETPQDNIDQITLPVRGAVDPNDKTCLEGDTIASALVGDYLHYLIRFQNTGTAPAVNIVVKDMIDTTKFDIASLQLIQSSHPQVTRIDGSKVEFIYENIMLPDETNNEPGSHGFIAFKIKTKSNLVIGNTVTNDAGIYFDYNFPVITNLASTTVAALSNQDFENASVTIYPNPAKNIVSISAKDTITSVQLFDVQGRLIATKLNASTETLLDLAQQQSGIYFIKVQTDTGMKVEKIVKE